MRLLAIRPAILKTFLVTCAIAVPVAGMLIATTWAHESLARRSTVYASGFSEQSFRSIQPGDTREHVTSVLGDPLGRSFVLRFSNGSYDGHAEVPIALLPAGSSVHLEVLSFSGPTHPPRDFRLVEVLLDSNGLVDSTRHYVTD